MLVGAVQVKGRSSSEKTSGGAIVTVTIRQGHVGIGVGLKTVMVPPGKRSLRQLLEYMTGGAVARDVATEKAGQDYADSGGLGTFLMVW